MPPMQPRLSSYPVDQRFRGRGKPTQAVRIEVLGQVALFEDLSRRNLTRIDQISRLKYAREGDVLVEQGDPGDEMMVVLDGRAAVKRGRRTIAECGPGRYFGEMALLDHEPRSASVVALEPMRLLVISGSDFRKVVAKVPRLAETLLATMSTRLREANAAADY